MSNATPKILIVEDSENILEMLAMMLSFQDWEPIKLNNLNDFIDTVTSVVPDVILMDMLLSGKNGCDACRELKSNEKLSKIPIVMMSAHPEAKKETDAAGADYFVSKPFEMEDLIATVEKAITHNT
jgi:two-component system alkaline phosphatase synthesis response regulator PhoP